MPSAQRSQSQDRSVKHQHSLEKVPMWDSSDPDRAPPPLPLNPGRDMSPTKHPTSANVAAAAQALVERARENMNGHYMTNPSPEKSPVKTPQHRRLQSLQTGQEPWSSPGPATPSDRSSSAYSARDTRSASPDRTPTREGSPTPVSSKRNSAMPGLTRSPTSATVLALRDMPVPDDLPALSDVTNKSTPTAKVPHSVESIHSQMQNLTTIANSLQKEMVALSRRSKDNATDLNTLKEATKARDEDIRKGLKEVITGMKSPESFLRPSSRMDHSRSSSSLGLPGLFIDNKPHASPPFVKSISLPKIPSANGTDIDSERSTSPTLLAGEGTASFVMLEKIIRDMVTKEGQDRLLETLTDLLSKSSRENNATIRKVEELVHSIKDMPESQALVRHKSGRRFSFEDAASEVESDLEAPQSRALAKGVNNDKARRHTTNAASASPAMEELTKMVQKVRDSVMHTGGMTSEVKTLVRDLRAQVSAVGQDLGKKINESIKQRGQNSTASKYSDQEELVAIVQDELSDLKHQMEKIISLRRSDSTSSSLSRNTVDSAEINAVVKHVLAEQGIEQTSAVEPRNMALSEEAIFNAIHDACKELQVDVQHDGLERDEILQCLKEGLEEYQSSKATPESAGASKDVVMKAVHEAMRDFKPPSIAHEETKELKDDILTTVKDCLDSYKAQIPKPSHWKPGDVTRDDIIGAVADALDTFKKEGAREIEISREDLFHAVKAGLDDTGLGSYGDDVLKSLHDIVEGMRVEFKQYSAANGRDTEQVLDAMKDGLETLRAEIETYVDRAQDVTGKDEIISTLKDNLHGLRDSLESFLSQQRRQESNSDNAKMADYMRHEFEQLHETLASQSHDKGSHHHSTEEILAAIAAGFAGLQAHKAAQGVDELPEEVLDALKTEFEQLREAVLNGTASQKDDVVDAMQSSLAGLQAQISGHRGFGDAEDIIRAMRDEFVTLKESMGSNIVQSGSIGFDKAEILESVQQSLESIRVQLTSDQSEANNETIGLIKEELETLRESIGGAMIPLGSQTTKEEIIEAIQVGLDKIHSSSSRDGGLSSDTALETVRAELEQMRESLATMVVPAGGSSESAQSQEILDAVRIGIIDLKEHIDNGSKQVSIPDSNNMNTISESMEELKKEISGLADRPVDMTMMHEILDTVKHGISGLAADIERLRSDNEIVLADHKQTRENTDDGIKRDDLQRFEVLLAQLQIKVEAMDENVQQAATTAANSQQSDAAASKTDLLNIQTALHELQANVISLASKDAQSSTGMDKEDSEEIKNLLYDTRAQIEERIIPGLDGSKKKEALEEIENVARMTHVAVENLTSQVGEPATKDDVAAIAHLLDSTSLSLGDLKDRMANDDEKITKLDIDALTVACADIKSAIKTLPSAEHAPSKTDIDELTVLLADLKETHDSLRDRYEGDIHVTAKAFDDRKEEATNILQQLDSLKTLVEESKDEIKSRMKRGNEDVRALDEILQGIEDKIDAAPSAVTDVQELMQNVTQEFGKAHSALEDLKLNNDGNSSTLHAQAEEHRAAIIAELGRKLDERCNELLVSQEVVKDASDKATETLKERASQQDELLISSRNMAEELKLTIDTLGSSVTVIAPALNEATEKISDDSRTVFNKIEEMRDRIDGAQTDLKIEHEQTRTEVLQVLTASNGLQELLSGFQPTALSSLNAILALVEQHFEHSRQHFQHSRTTGEKAEENHNKTWESMKTVSEFLPRLEAPSSQEPSTPVTLETRELEGSQLHTKLDELISLAAGLRDSRPQLEKLDDIHSQVMASAAEVSAFTEFQTKILAAQHDNKESEAKEAAFELERTQRESNDLHAQVVELKETKQSLASEISALKAEKESMMAQKLRLTGEVSSLETALNIRREELHMMDNRADALERRIIDRVMDHSRALLITKAPKSQVNMSLKRVGSSNSNSTNATTIPASSTASAVDMALKSKATKAKASPKPSDPSNRRILSLSQINNNVATGAKSLASAPRSPSSGLMNMKRSQSTRTPAVRKRESWAPGQGSLALYDKENADMAEESEIELDEGGNVALVSNLENSRPNTAERRASNSTSEWTYGTGSESYVTRSVSRSSIGSTIRTTVGNVSSIHEDEEDSVALDRESTPGDDVAYDQQENNEPYLLEAPPDNEYTEQQLLEEEIKKGLVLRTDGYDSGLGSDLPTAAAMSASNGEVGGYFRSLNDI